MDKFLTLNILINTDVECFNFYFRYNKVLTPHNVWICKVTCAETGIEYDVYRNVKSSSSLTDKLIDFLKFNKIFVVSDKCLLFPNTSKAVADFKANIKFSSIDVKSKIYLLSRSGMYSFDENSINIHLFSIKQQYNLNVCNEIRNINNRNFVNLFDLFELKNLASMYGIHKFNINIKMNKIKSLSYFKKVLLDESNF